MKTNAMRSLAVDFLRDESGVGTVFSLFLLMSFILLGGVAADVQSVITAKVQLQINSDAVAHAALVYRETMGAEDSKEKAVEISVKNVPTDGNGDVITTEDINFGYWNDASQSFTVDESSNAAVRAVARRNTDQTNPIGTFLLWIVGFDEWDVSVVSVFEVYGPTCMSEGFVAQLEVDIQSNNNYFNGFCIHSNDHVEINSNNYFEPGTRVSMPDLSLLELPASGFDQNDGLEEALVEGSLNIRILNKISDIITGVTVSGSSYYPDYITNTTVVTLNSNKPKITVFESGRVYSYNCSGNGGSGLTLPKGTLENVVIVTNCVVNFSQDVVIVSSVIATTNTSDKSVQGASGLILGKPDEATECTPGGESQIVTAGGFFSAAEITTNGSQIIAGGDIEFAARGDGMKGVSMIAGGLISGTSNMDMTRCGNMGEDNFQAAYFRLAR